MADSLRRQILAVVVLALVAVAATGGIAYRGTAALTQRADSEARARRLHGRLDTLLWRLDIVAAARQAYAVSGKAPDRARYDTARHEVDTILATLRAPAVATSDRGRSLIALDSAARQLLTPPDRGVRRRPSRTTKPMMAAGLTTAAPRRDDLYALAARVEAGNDTAPNAPALSTASTGDPWQRALIALLGISLAAAGATTWLLLRSVAARARLTDELRTERERLAAVLAQLPTGVAVADATTHQVIFGNARLAKILRRPFTATYGVPNARLATWLGMPPGPTDVSTTRYPLARALSDDVIVGGEELPLTRGDGSAGRQRVQAAPVRDASGRIVASVVLVEDVTAAHEAAREAARAGAQATRRVAQLQELTERVSTALTADDVAHAASAGIATAIGASEAVLFADRVTDGRLEPLHEWTTSPSGALDTRGARRHEPDDLDVLATEATHRGSLVTRATPDATLVALPLGAGPGVSGALTLAFRPPRVLSAEEHALLLAAGRIAAQGMTRARLQSLREEERRRLARELHDELGQSLTGLKLDLAWLSGQIGNAHPELVDPVRTMLGRVDDTVKGMRRIATQLRPGVLDDFGLMAALEWQASEFERRSGVACAIDVLIDDGTIDEPAATAIFRVFQEALTNVARHAGARQVRATLGPRDGTIVLHVVDDGVGIAQENGRLGFGLTGMRERAAALGGSVRVRPAAGGGTEVTLTLPARHAASTLYASSERGEGS